MTMSLTPKQHRLYSFIAQYITAHNGIAPTIDEMRSHLNLCSKSAVCRLLDAIQQRGMIRRLPHHARAIELIGQKSAPLISRRTLELVITQSAIEERPISDVIASAVAEYLTNRGRGHVVSSTD